jgi:hypothetical protein
MKRKDLTDLAKRNRERYETEMDRMIRDMGKELTSSKNLDKEEQAIIWSNLPVYLTAMQIYGLIHQKNWDQLLMLRKRLVEMVAKIDEADIPDEADLSMYLSSLSEEG